MTAFQSALADTDETDSVVTKCRAGTTFGNYTTVVTKSLAGGKFGNDGVGKVGHGRMMCIRDAKIQEPPEMRPAVLWAGFNSLATECANRPPMYSPFAQD